MEDACFSENQGILRKWDLLVRVFPKTIFPDPRWADLHNPVVITSRDHYLRIRTGLAHNIKLCKKRAKIPPAEALRYSE